MFPILLSQPQDIFEQLRLICNPNYTLKKKNSNHLLLSRSLKTSTKFLKLYIGRTSKVYDS